MQRLADHVRTHYTLQDTGSGTYADLLLPDMALHCEREAVGQAAD